MRKRLASELDLSKLLRHTEAKITEFNVSVYSYFCTYIIALYICMVNNFLIQIVK